MSKIERYAGNLRAFGSNAQGLERTLFGETTQADDLTSQVTAAFLRGWGIVGPSENPSLEDFNAAMYAMSQFIAYQHQMGIPEWDATQEYYTGSLCIHDGETYSSLVDDNIGSIPPSAKWTPVLTTKNGRRNLGFDALGIGGVAASLPGLDWQQFDFVPSQEGYVAANNMTNIPPGIDTTGWGTTPVCFNVIGFDGTVMTVECWLSHVTNSLFRRYQVRIGGAKGSRFFAVRQIFTSADVIPTANLDAPGRLLGAPKVFGTSGSYTPGVNVKAIVVEIVGGGGGGGGASSSANYNAAGGGGGGGGYAKKYIPISSTAAIAYTVGLGGNGATYPAVSGQNGGATTFGSGFTATGGSGGNTASSNASSSLVGMGGGGGTASGGNINSTGSGGQNGVSSSPTIAGGTMGAGFGGASVVSGQGGPGGGGPGAVTTSGNQNVNGNRGNDGLIIIWEYA
ncbi:glycine-rich domain-containing protein [Atlantibacter hermannii]|uniref:glycine-rich domain-containing protein n=1 Tax=Atlantibacter hermannii TaxID=565 RepID=UPI00289C7F89|nr:hypothetical protein [Atlantibacter hermannii]